MFNFELFLNRHGLELLPTLEMICKIICVICVLFVIVLVACVIVSTTEGNPVNYEPSLHVMPSNSGLPSVMIF